MEKKKTRTRATSPSKPRRKKSPDPLLPPPLILSDEELYGRVASKAYELYQQRGEEQGHDIEDWVTAERLVRAELQHGPTSEEPISIEEQ